MVPSGKVGPWSLNIQLRNKILDSNETMEVDLLTATRSLSDLEADHVLNFKGQFLNR